MAQLRFTIINYSNSQDRKFTVKVSGNDTEIFLCQPTGPIDPTMSVHKVKVPVGVNTNFEVPHGAMYGFIAGSDTTLFTLTPDENVVVYTAASKNPWPVPPPPPPNYSAADFGQRFAAFNRGGATGLESTIVQYVVTTQALPEKQAKPKTGA